MATATGSGTKKTSAINTGASSGTVDTGSPPKKVINPVVPQAPSGPVGATGTGGVAKASALPNPITAASTMAANPQTGFNAVTQSSTPAAAPSGLGGMFTQHNTDPLTGALAGYGYTPEGASQLYSNPNPLAADVLKGVGVNNPGMATDLAQYMNPALFANLILGGGQGATLTDNDALNFVAQYMQQQVTPGGRSPQFDVLMQDLMKRGGTEGNPLYDYLNYDPSTGQALDPAAQVKTGNQAAGYTLTSLNPLAQRAYQAALAREGQQYQDSTLKGGTPGASTYAQYLAQSPIAQWIKR